MTDKTKVRRLATAIYEASEQRCMDGAGGYPDQAAEVACHLVVASCVEIEPTLYIYFPETALKWYEEAAAYKRENGCEWSQALMETHPKADA